MTTLPAGWKPIESAPKDELILVGPTKRMGICVAMNSSEDGWVTETINEWHSMYTPTHWMPLPAPPCPTCNDQGAVGNILTAEPCPDCTPPASAQPESQREGYPHDDPQFVALCREHDILGTAMQGLVAVFWRASAQPERDWELTCDECNGDGFVYVERQVAERKSDKQEFKEDCECCEGRGFTIAFQDIPGIAEYVRKSRPVASAQDDAKDAVMDALAQSMGSTAYFCTRVWEAWHVGTMSSDDFVPIAEESDALADMADAVIAVMRPAPAAGDARDAAAPEWVACETRRPWVTNSLKVFAQDMRDKERRCRTAFNKDFMGIPSRYVADAYAEAAAVFEARLASIAASQQQEG